MDFSTASTKDLARLHPASGCARSSMESSLRDTELHISCFSPLQTMTLHQHAEASISIVVSGDMLEHIGRTQRTYARGHAALLPAGRNHSQQFGRTGARQVIFKPRPDWLEYLKDDRSTLEDCPHARSDILRLLGDRLCQQMAEADRFSALACEGLMLEIVAHFGRAEATAAAVKKPPPWLSAAQDFLHQNFAESPGMAQIARHAGRHEIHLAREFRRFFGVSVGAYLRQLRVDRAREMLQDQDLAISYIALSCGFANHSHLCREFKALFGVTPSRFRGRNCRRA